MTLYSFFCLCLSERFAAKVVCSGVVLASKSYGFNFADGVNECFLSLGVRGQIHHVADHDPDRRFAVLRLLNPLFHFLEAASFGDVEHVDAGG